MKKGSILLCDRQKFFYRILNKNFCNDFEIRNFSFFLPMNGDCGEDNFLIYVLYNESELYNFLSVFKSDCPVLVCVFNKDIYSKLAFLESGEGFFVLNANERNKSEIISDLSNYFNYSYSKDTANKVGDFLCNEIEFSISFFLKRKLFSGFTENVRFLL